MVHAGKLGLVTAMPRGAALSPAPNTSILPAKQSQIFLLSNLQQMLTFAGSQNLTEQLLDKRHRVMA